MSIFMVVLCVAAVIASFLVSACDLLVVVYLDGSLVMLSAAIFFAETVPAESVHGSFSSRAIGLVIGISE